MDNNHGLHHVTAVTASVKDNLNFYTNVLGLRLVKKTVNQDDVSAYHLFYSDTKGSPGADMTFFDWEQVGPRKNGTDQISRTYFRVIDSSALAYWTSRLADHGVATDPVLVAGQEGLLFEDPEGQRLGFVVDDGVLFEGQVWKKVVPAEVALRGFYAIELSVPDIDQVTYILETVLGWTDIGSYQHSLDGDEVIRFTMFGGGPGKEVHVRQSNSLPAYGSTAGSVHHAAFRVKNKKDLEDWIVHFDHLGIPNSGLVDRFYFQSLYFNLSRGILFEFATDGPGFLIDQTEADLGSKLALPPFLESQRGKIEASLKSLI